MVKKKNIKVIIVGAFPPPLFGSALMHQYICEIMDESIKFDKFELNFNKDFSKIETFSIKKIIKLILALTKFIFKIWRYDVVIITHSFRISALLKDSLFMIITKFCRRKLILYAQGLNFNQFYDKQRIIIKKYINYIFRRVNYFVTVGINQKEEYKLWTNDNITHIYNFVEVEDYNLIKEKSDKFRILFLSTLTESKGVFTFLNAIEILERKENNYQYILCGSFKEKHKEEKIKIENFVDKYKDKILLKGRVEGYKKAEAFINSDLFVFPTKNDSFGLANLEAMSYNLPIITTRQGAIKEYFKEPENGFFIKENDADDLASKIEIIANDVLLRKYIGEYNKNYVRQNFNREIFSKEWCSLIKKVVE